METCNVHTVNIVLMACKWGFAFCAQSKIHILCRHTDDSHISWNSHFISELWYFELPITRPHFTSPALGLSQSCLVCKEHMSRQTNQNHIVKRIFEELVIFPLSHSFCFQVTVSFGTLPLVVIFARTWAFHSRNVKWQQLDIKLLFNLSLLPRLEDSNSIHHAGARVERLLEWTLRHTGRSGEVAFSDNVIL